MTARITRRGALLAAVCFALAVCIIVPSIRGTLTRIAQQIMGRVIVYYNDELQDNGIDEDNYNFGYDRYEAAKDALENGEVKTLLEWVATKDGTGDFYESLRNDPSLVAAIGLDIDEKLAPPEKILRDEQDVVIGQRADAAHLHFLKDQSYWDRAVELITKYLTSGSIKIETIKKYSSSMYMLNNGLEGNKPSVIVRKTANSGGHVVVFNLGKPGMVKFRLECGYQPIDVGYWPVPPGPAPGPDPDPEPTPEPKDPDGGPQGQTADDPNPDFGGGPNHDPDTTLTDEPTSPPAYKPPAPPTAEPTQKPTAAPKPTAKPTDVVIGDGQDHTDLTIVQQTHSPETVEQPVAQDGINEGDLDESAVE